MTPVTVVIIVISALLLVFLAAAFAAYRFTFHSPNATQNDDHTILMSPEMEPMMEDIHRMIDELNARPFERVDIPAHDGLRLYGRYYHLRDDAPLAICFHGYRGTPSRDFCGGSRILFDHGFNVLLVEERAHCTSEGHTITFGVKERLDCLAWLHHFHYRFPRSEIMLFGVSMGAGTVLMAGGMPLPDCVRGVVADCPFTEPKAIIQKVGADIHIPRWLTGVLAPVAAGVFGRFRLSGASALKAVRLATKPILLIHGEADTFVPCDMSRQLHEANPEITQLETFPGANHGISYLIDPARYEKLVCDFARRVLKHPERASL